MRHQFFVLMGALAAVVVVALAPVVVARQAPATGATGTALRTPWGDPDLQGVWIGTTPTPLERPLEGAKAATKNAELGLRGTAAVTGASVPTGTLEEAEQYASQRLEIQRSAETRAAEAARKDSGTYNAFWQNTGRAIKGQPSLIVDPPDGRMPPLTAEGKARIALRPVVVDDERGPVGGQDNPEQRSPGERCVHWELLITGGVTQSYRIVQVPGFVAINMERLHDSRVIPLDGRPHLPQDVRQWDGDSVGHWEGNTLVVDTTNFTNKANFRGSSEKLHVIERFTRVDANTIAYQATIDDPATWTRSWTLALPMWKEKEGTVGIFDYACHEGNDQMASILGGGRADDKAAAAKKARPTGQ